MADEPNRETKPLTQSLLTQKPRVQPKYDVHRDVLTHELVIQQTGYVARGKSIPYAIRQGWASWSIVALFTSVLPILQWLPKYSLRRDLMGDMIAGFTVAVMHIPHGMAYGILAGVSAGNGMYMAVFPVLVYIIFGTSHHISMGTFSVISMMTLKVVQTYATEDLDEPTTPYNATTTADAVSMVAAGDIITPLEVVTSLSLVVGLMHFIKAICRLGTVSSLLSDPLVNGFTTGAAVHVVTAQLKEILGISVPRYKGAFKIVYTVIDVLKGIPNTNLITLGFCVSVMIFMVFCNELLKPCLRKSCRMPFPGELIAVIGGTLISKALQVHDLYGVSLVGEIPSGLPAPQLPRLDLMPLFITDSFAIAFVSFSIVMSMGVMFAKKHSYEVRANQELFAMGLSNVVGGCFSCIPVSCSLSRSVIQEQTGGVTQLASLVAAGIIVVTLLWAGPFFSDLPRCVLAAVIIVALKTMFTQAKELRTFAKQGKLELLIWIGTFFSVVLIDIDIGLLIGICMSTLMLYIKGLKPYSCLLGTIPETAAIYVDLNHHGNAVHVPETRIFRYSGSINFATGRFYRTNLYTKLGLNEKQKKSAAKTAKSTSKYEPVQQLNGDLGENAPTLVVATTTPITESEQADRLALAASAAGTFNFLILDFSSLGHIDIAGCNTISEIQKDMNQRQVRLLLATPTDRVYDTLMHSMALGEGPFEIFPSLHDAVVYANACRTV